MKFRFIFPTVNHVIHCVLMVTWIFLFTYFAHQRQNEAPNDIFETYGSVKGLLLLLIRLISLLAFPQTFLNFVSLLIFETFKGAFNISCGDFKNI